MNKYALVQLFFWRIAKKIILITIKMFSVFFIFNADYLFTKAINLCSQI